MKPKLSHSDLQALRCARKVVEESTTTTDEGWEKDKLKIQIYGIAEDVISLTQPGEEGK